MPITTSIAPLKTQLESSFKSDLAGSPELLSTLITSAIASIAPSGLFPVGSALIPLAPTGFTACQNQLLNSVFKLDLSGNSELTAVNMSLAISLLCPIVPPIGLTLLKTQLKTAFEQDLAGNPSLSAQLIATAIINYFVSGGVI